MDAKNTELKFRVDLLKEIKIFAGVSENSLQEIASFMTEEVLDPNQTLFYKGDNLNALYIITEGIVKIHDGPYIFTELHHRNFFGEYSLIDSYARSATVTAIEKTKLLKLDQEKFNLVADKHPDIHRSILMAMIKRLRNNNILEERLTRISKEIEQQKNEIDKKRKELEALNASKDRFFSIIAHDLKNPLSTIIGLSDLLLNNIDSFEKGQIKDFAIQMNIFANKSFELLENLLHWSRSQLGALKPVPKEIFLYDIVQETIELLKGIAINKNITVSNLVEKKQQCYADQHMVTTIIRNLMNNALKFTPKDGQIKISSIHLGNLIEVHVTDSGIGIKKEDIDNLFNITTNRSTPGTNQEKGTGLGLVLTHEFIEKNGGTIWVESEFGKGSDFIFTLPASKPVK